VRRLALASVLLPLLGGGCGVFSAANAHPVATPADEDALAAEGSGGLAEAAPSAVAAVPMAGEAMVATAESAVVGTDRDEAPPMRRTALAGGQTTVAALAGPASPDRLVINGSVVVRTADVAQLVLDIRARVAEVGGSVVGESIRGSAEEGHAEMRLRLPPSQAVPFADWLGTRATLEARNLDATDVSRQFVDQELAIKNLNITMGRLQELARRPDAPLKDVLEAERELTRVRGELERMEGEHRLLADQIARATLTVNIRPRKGAHEGPVHVEPELKFELMPRIVALHFLDARGRDTDRLGGGVSLMFTRAFSIDFWMLPRNGVESRSFLLYGAVAGYSDFMGGGRRRFLNPYLGVRAGGGLLEGNGAFSMGADVGLELVHWKHFLLEVSGRGVWYVYHKDLPYDVTLEATAGIGVPF
jgi:hypothetical protein